VEQEAGLQPSGKRRSTAGGEYYSLTRLGRRQLEKEADNWGRLSSAISRSLRSKRRERRAGERELEMRPEHWLFTIPLRCGHVSSGAGDQELDDELRDHLKQATEQYVAKGMHREGSGGRG